MTQSEKNCPMLSNTLQARKSLQQPDEQDSAFPNSFLCLKYRVSDPPKRLERNMLGTGSSMIGVCVCVCVCVCARVRMCAQSCLTLCDPMDCSSPGSFVHGVLQARILKWVAISFSRESSWPSNQIRLSSISRDHIVHTVFKLFFFSIYHQCFSFLKIFLF